MNPKHGKLLVVDDDETNRDVLAHRLGRAGYVVSVAEDGSRALALLSRQHFDLVLLDVMMPGPSGLEVLQTLRQTYALTDLPVIMATAMDQSADVVQALERGANDYVTKPIDFPVVLARIGTQLALKRAVEQIRYLREEIQSTSNFEEIIGQSPALRELLDKVKRIAATDSTVLIMGESGTGKELIARAIHNLSPRRAQPLVKVNCGAISAGLVESELFGHEKGAFTGAQDCRIGRFELANGGTIFLDEVGELPLQTQVKLLRVLQEQEFERVGSSQSQRVDVRVIAVTNRDLAAAIHDRSFREDLYYRLNVVPLQVPALRERTDDIPRLVEYFLGLFGKKLGKHLDRVSTATMQRLVSYPWPGNIRELKNLIERAAVLSTGPVVALEDYLGPVSQEKASSRPPTTMEEAERAHILRVLEQTQWTIEGKDGAAAILDLPASTLRSRMNKLGISRSAAP
jgi:DNA-binding NtrC family response regulator